MEFRIWTSARVTMLADILANIGYIVLGSVAIPFIFSTPNLFISGTGFLLAVAFWLLSLVLLRENL